MKREVTLDGFRRILQEEIDERRGAVERVKVSYCCPVLLGGYKREGSDIFDTDINAIVEGVSQHTKGCVTIAKTDAAYDGDFGPYTLFVDILVLPRGARDRLRLVS